MNKAMACWKLVMAAFIALTREAKKISLSALNLGLTEAAMRDEAGSEMGIEEPLCCNCCCKYSTNLFWTSKSILSCELEVFSSLSSCSLILLLLWLDLGPRLAARGWNSQLIFLFVHWKQGNEPSHLIFLFLQNSQALETIFLLPDEEWEESLQAPAASCMSSQSSSWEWEW